LEESLIIDNILDNEIRGNNGGDQFLSVKLKGNAVGLDEF
jgi:hypothetical protein